MSSKKESKKHQKKSLRKLGFNFAIFIGYIFFLTLYGISDKLILIHHEEMPIWFWFLLSFQVFHMTGIVKAFQ